MSWSYVHGAWTLNRLHTHSTTKISPFELVFGRTYKGCVARFGGTVLLLHQRGLNCKHGLEWVPGVWLGKAEAEDLDLVATPQGLLRGNAIWRSVWLFMIKERPFQPTGRKALLKDIQIGSPVTSLPVADVHPGPSGDVVDYDARGVMEYARNLPEDSDQKDAVSCP